MKWGVNWVVSKDDASVSHVPAPAPLSPGSARMDTLVFALTTPQSRPLWTGTSFL